MMGQPHKSPSIPPKVLWPILILVILGIAVGGFFLLNSYIYNEKQGDDTDNIVPFSGSEFDEGGIRFEIPPHVLHSQQSTAIEYSFYTEGPMVLDTSSVYLSIPRGDLQLLENDQTGDIPEEAVKSMVNWGNLQGDRYSYSATISSGDVSWEVSVTKEIYPVSFSNTPIVLKYSHSVHDDTLETLWDNIHNNVEIDIESNLRSYQEYTRNLNAKSQDTTDWQTYTNEEYGYTAKYPNSWTVEEKNILEDPYKEGRPGPFRSIDFKSADQEHLLNVYLKKSNDVGTSLLGGGIGAGDFVKIDNVDVAGYSVPAIHNIYQGKVKTLFTPDAGAITSIGDYDFGAQFADLSGDYDETDLLKETEYYQALSILKSISL